MSVWDEQAIRWKHVGLPTRPSPEDSKIIASVAKQKYANHPVVNIAILGVTPEVIQLDWPEGSVLSAVDMNRWMIDTLYKPHTKYPTTVHEARWQTMPMVNHSVDLIAGDGIFTPLASLEEYHTFFEEMKRIVKPGGTMIVRAFIRPDMPEEIDEILKDALAGNIKHFGALKWRLAMALVEDDLGVSPSEIHRVFQASFPDRQALSHVSGWTMETIETIDSYRDMESVFTFPRLDQLRTISRGYATISNVHYASYELSQRCPTIVFEF